MTRILVAESREMSEAAIAVLRAVGDVTLADLTREQLVTQVADVDVLWVRLRTKIDAPVLEAAHSLRILATATTGLDHIDLETARARGIDVISLRGATELLRDVRATAELTIGLMLSLLRKIPLAVRDVHDGNWRRDRFKGRELRHSRVGLLGYGRLGQLVARYLHAFGAEVIATDPHVAGDDNVRMVALDELLSTSDIISIHASQSRETHHLVGRAELARCKPSALLVNTSRGDLVDSAALLDALTRGSVAGAALDVLEGESANGVGDLALVEYARNNEHLLITPHIGGCTHESMSMTENYIAAEIVRRLETTR